ncbi:LIM domain-containing protein A-like [Danaus plexippus]|uniref:Uncharacterized protein n=1 Tax=Danaus plexippus plexippus TaxID=278856 RepID=A0A212EXJ0_DANPL|nr:LIM domain-containing protein A-like [Danaus plexippus]OWR46212.1 hypothetical protein KGM_200088 [Danaus plexippus plexippus]
MNYVKCMMVFVVLFVDNEAGGHGEKHHNHVRVHVPKFVHHDHHTKTITIHHHHHKPKKEHHHHHHHHHKPKAPEGHHYHQHHKKTSTHSVSKGHSSHGNHGHHGHHSHHGHHGHHGHEHKHHDIPLTYDLHYEPPNYEPPTINYQPPSISFNPNSASEEDFDFKSLNLGSPKVHGVVHTVKETKVFDSLPNAFAGASVGNSGNTGSHGYEVTEQGEEAEDDIYTAVNSLPQTYPGTYGFVRNAAPENIHDPFAEIAPQNNNLGSSVNTFQAASNPSFSNVQDFSSDNDPFQSPITNQIIQPSELSNEFDDVNPGTFSDPNHLVGFSSAEDLIDDTPTSFNREAGVQQTINTGGLETLTY